MRILLRPDPINRIWTRLRGLGQPNRSGKRKQAVLLCSMLKVSAAGAVSTIHEKCAMHCERDYERAMYDAGLCHSTPQN